MIVISFQGRLQLYGDKHNIHWVPILNLVKRDYKGNERKEQNQTAAEERAERAEERRKRSIERQEVEVAEKRKHLNVSGDRVVDIHFTETSTSTSTEEVEQDPGISNATEWSHQRPVVPRLVLQAMLKTTLKEASQSPQKTPKHKPRSLNTCFIGQHIKLRTEYFRSDDKVRFYTGLPSYQVLVATFNHVAPHVSRRTQALDPFQEFVLVLIKPRLNVPFKDLAYRFLVSVPTVSRIFSFFMDECHGLQVASACSLA